MSLKRRIGDLESVSARHYSDEERERRRLVLEVFLKRYRDLARGYSDLIEEYPRLTHGEIFTRHATPAQLAAKHKLEELAGASLRELQRRMVAS